MKYFLVLLVMKYGNFFLQVSTFYFLFFITLQRRCMECRRGLAMRILSVRLSNACIETTEESYV